MYVKPLLNGAMEVFWAMYWLYATGWALTVASGNTGQAPVGPKATVDCAETREMRDVMYAMSAAGAATRGGAMAGECCCYGPRRPRCSGWPILFCGQLSREKDVKKQQYREKHAADRMKGHGCRRSTRA